MTTKQRTGEGAAVSPALQQSGAHGDPRSRVNDNQSARQVPVIKNLDPAFTNTFQTAEAVNQILEALRRAGVVG